MSCPDVIRKAFKACGRDDEACLAEFGVVRDGECADGSKATQCVVVGDSETYGVCGATCADAVYGVHLFGSPSRVITPKS